MADEPVPQEPSPRQPIPASPPSQEQAGAAPLGLLAGGLSLLVTSIAKALDKAGAVGGQRPGARSAEKPELPVSPPSERSFDLVRAGLVGLIMESEKQATRGVTALDRGIRETARLVPGSDSPAGRRMRSALLRETARMEARGRAEVDRLAAIGLAEEQQAAMATEAYLRDLAAKMVDEVVSLSIQRVADSPEIHQVIRTESTGLFEDFLSRLRASCANADEVGERGARRLFRRGRPRPQAGADPHEPQAAASIEPPSVIGAAAGVFMSPAGFVSRALALVIDACLVTVAAAVGGYMISATLAALRPGILGDYLAAVPVGLGGILFVVYFVFCWTVFGRTIGMAFIGLKVLTLNGGRISFPRAVLRYVGYLISSACVFVGFLWVLIDNRRLGWLDHIARTQVVNAPPSAGHRARGAGL